MTTAPTTAGVSSDLVRRAESLFPGGVNSPVRAFRSVARPPLLLQRGKGPHVWDVDGRRYIDYIGSWGPAILGHADAGVMAAMSSALSDGLALGATHPLEIELGEAIRLAMPSMERLRFTSSGTEAVMSAVRLARAATGRDLIVKFGGGYHGHADHLLVNAGSGIATHGIPGSAGVPDGVAALTVVLPYNDRGAVEAAFRIHRGQVAAVIVEPVAANVGVIPPVPGFLETVRAVTAADGALLIFDEVITGFRLGRGGAQGLMGITPDLTTLGKIIGGGMPIGAYGGRADLMAMIAPSGPVYQAGTLSGHPLAMAAGIATLAALTPERYEALEATAAGLEAGLRSVAAAPGGRIALARVGSLLTVFFADEPPVNAGQALAADRSAFTRFFGQMLDRGVLLPPSPFEAWFVSMAHGRDEIAATITAVTEALTE
ncbi:MAG: glutamate-1-semialdehyde 2,1-aminomutase [Chloroflexi bacterium]|nr:glutamate-1-semialdehyde 2,1-aminomutase [Chloroflexota bacterium]